MNVAESDKHYTIECLKPEDIPTVVQFLTSFFYEYEPLNATLNLSDHDRLTKAQRSAACISENGSFKAVRTNTGEIIGVSINRILDKSTFSYKNNSTLTFDEKRDKTKLVTHLLDYIDEQMQLFETYPDCGDRMLTNELIGTSPHYQGMGIGSGLLQRTIDYQREQNIRLLKIECNNRFTAKMCTKLGCDKAYGILYRDYYVDGVNPLCCAPPNDVMEIYLSKI